MPYAVPSPSTSPVATMTFSPTLPSPKSAPLPPPVPSSFTARSFGTAPPQSPQRRDAAQRPARHHQRSHSSEPIASTSSFIFVQPASPEAQGPSPRSTTPSYLWTGASPSSPAAGAAEDRYATVPRQTRRIRLAALTPKESGRVSPNGASSSPGPSSQEEGEQALRGRKEGKADQEDLTPRAGDSIFTNSFPFGPSSSTPSPMPTPEEDAITQKPALMVRKKSGELVRPSLKADTMRRDFSKPRSAPATPVCPKYVHFDTQLEHVKHFLAQQRPAAVSRSGSPVETETEDEPEAFPFPAMATAQAGTVKLVLPNFPTASSTARAMDKDAFVESLEMTSDAKSIRGIVRVKNLAFQKWVAVRFTLDNWQTVSEVSAEHHESLPGGNSDRFAFTIKLQDLLARIEEKTMYLAVRYTVGGQEIWDNNDNQNYRIEFRKLAAPPPSRALRAAEANAAMSRQAAENARKKNAWSVTNAGQAADRMADLRRELDRLVREDNFDDDDQQAASSAAATLSGLAGTTGLGFGGSSRNGDRDGGRKFGPDSRSYSENGMGPTSLSGRYDFGNSLKMYTDKPGGGMKPREGGSPRLNVPLPVPNSSNSFFNPVSTSPQRPRAPPLPASARIPSATSPPQPFATTIINGMPATVFDPSASAPSSMIINSHRPSATDSPLHSPRPQLQPDFGLPSTSMNGGAGGGATAFGAPSKAYYSPTLPNFQAPRSPPRDPSASSYFYMAQQATATNGQTSASASPYLPLQDIPGNAAGRNDGFNNGANGAPRTRYHSYPVGSDKARGDSSALSAASTSASTGPGGRQAPNPLPYSPLVPPSFRDNRGRNSPFASPAPSPPNGFSPAGSPPRPRSPLPSTSSGKLRSPPPERNIDSLTNSDSDDAQVQQGLWSPATTDSISSTASASSSGSSNSAGTSRGMSALSPFLPAGRLRDGSEDSNTSSLLSSPESDATSMPPDSPGYGGGMSLEAEDVKVLQRPSNALEFSHFLDRYRFHLQSNPSPRSPSSATSPPTSSLGLSASSPPSSLLPSPTTTPTTASDFFAFAAAATSPVPISSVSQSPSSNTSSTAGSPTPPRRLSPLAQAAVAQQTGNALQPANGTTIVS
ncbi:hypothetical protein JCM11251_005984 [Rhodosporidiobolus azoricus]